MAIELYQLDLNLKIKVSTICKYKFCFLSQLNVIINAL